MVPFPGTFSLNSHGNRVWNNKMKADELQSKEVYTNIYYNLTEYSAMLWYLFSIKYNFLSTVNHFE